MTPKLKSLLETLIEYSPIDTVMPEEDVDTINNIIWNIQKQLQKEKS